MSGSHPTSKHPVMEYFMTVSKLWGKHISGPVLAFLSIGSAIAYAYASKPTTVALVTKYGALLTGIATVVLIFAAHYEAWKIERDNYEAEAARNGQPELCGRARDFTMGPRPVTESTSQGRDGIEKKEIRFNIEFKIEICNYRPMKTNLMNVALDGSKLPLPTIFSDVRLSGSPSLEQGMGCVVSVYASTVISGVTRRDMYASAFHLDNLVVGAVDGFGNYHPLAMCPAESIWFASR
jgi:hypothetical protein